MTRKPTWTHEKVKKYIANYQSMATRLGLDLDNPEFMDAAEVLQSYKLVRSGGYKVTWISGPFKRGGQTVCDITMDVSSLSDPKSRPYEVKATARYVDGDTYSLSFQDMDHACKESQFSEKYGHRGGRPGAEHHKGAVKIVLEKEMPFWCKRRKKPEIKIEKAFKEIPEFHMAELLKILDKEGRTMKSIPLRERIIIYLHENDLELYEGMYASKRKGLEKREGTVR